MDNLRRLVVSEQEWNQMFQKGKFKKQDMDTLVMDFLISKEFYNVAQAFQRESGCEPGIEDLLILKNQTIIRDQLFSCQYDEAVDLIIKKISMSFFIDRPRLHFRLEQQKMVEMCRRGEYEAALAFSRKFIEWENIVYEDYAFKNDCRRTLLLMMFGDNLDSPAADLLDFTKVFDLAMTVVEAITASQGRKTSSMIERALKIMTFVEFHLSLVAKFPHFNIDTGYPEPPAHSHRYSKKLD